MPNGVEGVLEFTNHPGGPKQQGEQTQDRGDDTCRWGLGLVKHGLDSLGTLRAHQPADFGHDLPLRCLLSKDERSDSDDDDQ